MNHFAHHNYAHSADLKALMTAPPMSAERHAMIIRKRIEMRRMLEEMRERRGSDDDLYNDDLVM